MTRTEATPSQLLELADRITAHNLGNGSCASTIWCCASVRSRLGRSLDAGVNDLVTVKYHLLDLREMLAGTCLWPSFGQEPTEAAAAMIRHVQRRGPSRRIRPLSPQSRAALTAYLHERVALMDEAERLTDPWRSAAARLRTLARAVRRRALVVLDELAEREAA